MTFSEHKSIDESLDMVDIIEPKLNKTKIISLITDSLKLKNAPSEFIDKVVSHFDSLTKLYGYNKTIDNSNILVYYYLNNSSTELHFVDLNHLEQTGKDLNINTTSVNVFAYIISVMFKETMNNKDITIVAPSGNEKRLRLYKKMADTIIKRHSLNMLAVLDGNELYLQNITIKEGINPFLRGNI